MDHECFVYVRDLEKIVHKTNGRHSRLIATEKDMGTAGFIMGVHTMDPGGRSGIHKHVREQEAMYFFSGQGIATISGTEYKIEPDSVLLAPAGSEHGIQNTGKEPLRFVFVYCPPLPEHISREEYFKKAKDKID